MSNERRIYRMSPWRLAICVLIGLALVSGRYFAAGGVSAWVFPEIICAAVLIPLTVFALRYRVILFEDKIEVRYLRKTHSALKAEIVGCAKFGWNTGLFTEKNARPAVVISMLVGRDVYFKDWLNSIPELKNT